MCVNNMLASVGNVTADDTMNFTLSDGAGCNGCSIYHYRGGRGQFYHNSRGGRYIS